MQGIHWQEMVTGLVKEGRISMSRIDESVRRILMTKFKLGLFEHPYANAKDVKKVCMSTEHMNTALEAARNSIVLLKNDGILPLQADKYKKVLVTGINADSQNILGDWSLEQGDKVSTVLKGLRQVAPNTEFDFVDQGVNPKTMTAERVNEAVEHAKNCDLNIVVAGEYMIRAHWNDRSDGENSDRSDLNLVGLQEELIEKLAATGKPTILILINGRPMSTEWAANNLPALVEAWAPGICGGQAIAEILYGKVNPSAKLAITVPRTVGQVQMIYNKKPSADYHPFVCSNDTPLFPFGFGKSYTTYEYKNLKLDASTTSRTGTVTATVQITNTGNQEGVEIAQLYIHDKYSSVTRPVKELKDFSRVSLKPGETKEVSFRITPDKLAFYDQQMNYIVEPGEFEVMVGSSSADKDLLKQTFTVK
jgi:beta-glucosidase